jgi:ferredoxin
MRVWIDEGCIACRACEFECPEVFQVAGTTSTVRGAARRDGRQDPNRQRVALTDEAAARWCQRIADAASGCPVSVIRFDEEDAPAEASFADGAATA